MAVSRFGILTNKKSALMKQQMREIAKLLAEDPPKEEKAKIRAEALIRDDNTIEAYEILQLTCELLAERIKLVASEKKCPEDLVSSISTLLWASSRVDIPELVAVKKQFTRKYGRDFVEHAMENHGGILNERIVAKLSVQPPTAFLVQTYLEKISDEFDVGWKPTVRLLATELAEPMAAPIGYSVQVAQGTGLTPASISGEGTYNTSNVSTNDTHKDGMLPPYATSIPLVPAAAMPAPSENGDVSILTADDQDIYVPAAPSNMGRNSNAKSDLKDDKSSGNNNDDNNGATYEDLQAQFSQLKR
eukprot:CAMPEP_0197825828 /NCGR_PEP_ID=MMETSP1437-20131217/2861_1 /TAXON_ID=49252 ORGANISM="Eucampia antarctica, Strain CCMP1452" /NCGR_SAMPLE_ID=MMETSP1437 /ASSEMBLY_ACC=CAM_ASM_001096 /LENGTH=302 /DNA_ID=CAMNT_0043425997 /DNA_START=189 /DNA_END=1097 /DNA_ORIENTATION=-